MHCHYVPKKYLKGFTNIATGKLWAYSKEGNKFPCNVDNAAKINRYYPESTEGFLADQIENPANHILEKIRSQHRITEEDKKIFSEYLVVLIKRVPRGKERAKDLMPSAVKDFRKVIDRDFNIVSTQYPQKEIAAKRYQSTVHQVLDKYLNEFPDHIWLDTLPPEYTPQTVSALTNMTWRFLTYEQAPAFLTSDNPVFYFEGIGIGKPESELSFPVSSSVALWASWRSDLREGYFPTTLKAVKELNRRTACNATDYLYHAREEDWILPFFKKGKWQLNRLI